MKQLFVLLAAFVVAAQVYGEDNSLHSNDSSSSISTPIPLSHAESAIEGPVKNTTVEDDDDDDDDSFLTKLEVLLVEVHDDALQKCILGNLTEDLARARKADEKLEECYEPATDAVINHFSDSESPFDFDVLKNATKTFCRQVLPLRENCLRDYYHDIESCVIESDMKGIKIYQNMISAGLEYFCHYEAEVLKEAAENYFGCNPSELIVGLAFCTVPPFQEVVRNHNSSMAIPRVLLGKGCRLYKDMTQCVNEELSTCKNSTFSNIIVGLFNVTANALLECPSERTEWEQYMGRVVGQLYKEEQTQTNLLNTMKAQLDRLIAASDQQLQFHQEESRNEANKNTTLNSIKEILNSMKAARVIKFPL